MAEKTIKRNLVLLRRTWDRLAVIAANAGVNRAQVVRTILEGVCSAPDPSIYLPQRAKEWMAQVDRQRQPSGSVAPAPAAAPPPESKPPTPDSSAREEIWVCVQCFTVTPVSNPNCGSCGQPRPPMPIPAQPQKHDVPDDWLNRFGLTQDQQDSYLEDYALDYWPPDRAPEPEPFPDEWFEEYGPLEGQVNPRTGQRWTPPDAAPDTNGVAH
jgi:hypothetical protein